MFGQEISLSKTLILLPALLVASVFLKLFYNVFLHPLRSYPGPLLARATVITYQRKMLKGCSHIWLQELHEKYGPVVRLTPNELSFIDPAAWKDVYGHHASEFTKGWEGYGPDPYGSPPGILRADKENHAAQRRLVSHAFSDKALKEQETLLKGYASLMVQRLRETAVKGAVNIVNWYNFTTFDIMADLTFGESLEQLQGSTYDPWVKAVFSYTNVISLGRIIRAWPGLGTLMNMLVPAEMQKGRETHLRFSSDRVDKRMARKTERPDIWTFVTKHSEVEGRGLLKNQLHSNVMLFMIAGTETTATELSGLTYLLLRNPDKFDRLKKEIRSTFSSYEEMTMVNLTQLPYLAACIEEGLRLYPPVPSGLQRKTPKGGATVCGYFVPEGTMVQIPAYAAHRSPQHWTNADEFVPERHLPEGQAEYASDCKALLQPFSYGPRNCLGKNLAYHEMRLLLSSVLFHFDLELDDKTNSNDWFKQESHILWDKRPLLIKLTPVN